MISDRFFCGLSGDPMTKLSSGSGSSACSIKAMSDSKNIRARGAGM